MNEIEEIIPSSPRKQWKKIILGTVFLRQMHPQVSNGGSMSVDNVVGVCENGTTRVTKDATIEVNTVLLGDTEEPNTLLDAVAHTGIIHIQKHEEAVSHTQTSDDDKRIQLVEGVRDDLIKQFNSYSIVLTVLVTVTFAAFLQPPGSTNSNGTVRSSNLIVCFMFFATSSFMSACIGLFTGVIGSATLLRPGFFPHYAYLSRRASNRKSDLNNNRDGNGVLFYQRWPCDNPDPGVVFDNDKTLGDVILDNLSRVQRLRLYMGFSLVMCILAFLFSGLAITTGTQRRNIVALAVAISLGAFFIFFESSLTLLGPTWGQNGDSLIKKVPYLRPLLNCVYPVADEGLRYKPRIRPT